MLKLHTRDALKQKDDLMDSWISKTALTMLEANQSTYPLQEFTSYWTQKDLILRADCLGYYLPPENVEDAICYLLDAARRLFYPK